MLASSQASMRRGRTNGYAGPAIRRTIIVMTSNADRSGTASDREALRAWPMIAVCFGASLPWDQAARSGILGDGKYPFLFGIIGLTLYALAAVGHLDIRWWRVLSVQLALGCLALAAIALDGYGALGAIVTAMAAVAWLVLARRIS